jgi:hypothetical protein
VITVTFGDVLEGIIEILWMLGMFGVSAGILVGVHRIYKGHQETAAAARFHAATAAEALRWQTEQWVAENGSVWVDLGSAELPELPKPGDDWYDVGRFARSLIMAPGMLRRQLFLPGGSDWVPLTHFNDALVLVRSGPQGSVDICLGRSLLGLRLTIESPRWWARVITSVAFIDFSTRPGCHGGGGRPAPPVGSPRPPRAPASASPPAAPEPGRPGLPRRRRPSGSA